MKETSKPCVILLDLQNAERERETKMKFKSIKLDQYYDIDSQWFRLQLCSTFVSITLNHKHHSVVWYPR